MKTKVKIKKIPTAKTNVPINSPAHRIWEIKKEIADDFITPLEEDLKVEVFEMWEEDKM